MLSDHLLIPDNAAPFEMYLLCSCSSMPPMIARRKPPTWHSHVQKRKGHFSTTYFASYYRMPYLLQLEYLMQTLELMRKHLGLSATQQAILGTLLTVDSSRAKEPAEL